VGKKAEPFQESGGSFGKVEGSRLEFEGAGAAKSQALS
jgi:hypothetical protein